MKKIVTISVAAALLAIAPLSHAQFGSMLGNVKSALGSGSSGGGDIGARQDQLVRSYVAAGKDVSTANSHLADALGIKAQAVNAAATSDSLSAKDIEEQDKAISANTAAVSEALKSGATLKDSEAKAKYAQGLLFLATGVKKYIGMSSEAQGFTSGLSSISPLQLGKLQAGAYVVKSVPTSVTNLTSVLKSAVDFARNNGVEIPQDATSLL
ncbi:hypothetical protein [Ottowia thiooxydans]|uniref:Uncharacterized protein n=1 Tax=Ottowia thiooxydans TaxID=219182 RepID=A0ABV2Q6I6_9BURK